jgi:hypothetical protein
MARGVAVSNEISRFAHDVTLAACRDSATTAANCCADAQGAARSCNDSCASGGITEPRLRVLLVGMTRRKSPVHRPVQGPGSSRGECSSPENLASPRMRVGEEPGSARNRRCAAGARRSPRLTACKHERGDWPRYARVSVWRVVLAGHRTARFATVPAMPGAGIEPARGFPPNAF